MSEGLTSFKGSTDNCEGSGAGPRVPGEPSGGGRTADYIGPDTLDGSPDKVFGTSNPTGSVPSGSVMDSPTDK